ncbi:MAG: hypothetical protein H0W02_18240 [Ktedonobacteraceae bacterium]|nr:hypothetical protein [Ktedonobacteraceae bacterium]
MHTVDMPRLGDTMQEGTILCWSKLVGEPVQKGDSLTLIETDKVNIEMSSPAFGVLRAIFVPTGETVAVGTAMALIGDIDEPLPDPLPGQLVEVTQRCTDKMLQKEDLSPLEIVIGLVTSLAGLTALFMLIQRENWYRGNWMIAAMVACMLLVLGFCLGIVYERWRHR